jgi:hypothetical protein
MSDDPIISLPLWRADIPSGPTLECIVVVKTYTMLRDTI